MGRPPSLPAHDACRSLARRLARRVLSRVEAVIVSSLTIILSAAGGFVVIYLLLLAAVGVRRREPLVIRCPATHELVIVELDDAGGIRGAMTPTLRIRECSSWPARSGCDQACLRDLAAPPLRSSSR